MSGPGLAIEVDRLGKRYRLGLRDEKSDTLVGSMAAWLRSPFRSFRRLRDLTRFGEGEETPDAIWALRDVSFQLNVGEALAVIGRNGAGKSTLLKILSRITPPSTGRATLAGRVASLLEVGTGFHPELTGRENIYLNGTLLGMTSREVDSKLEEIVEFAGVGKFLETPIKRYSSGMQVRLAFSVAAHLDAEVLIVDEVLAVGDLEFQRKCLGRMGTLTRSGRTVLFVSHNMPVVKTLCSRGIVLNAGRVTFEGSAPDAVSAYMASAPVTGGGGPVMPDSIRYSTGEAVITRANVESSGSVLLWGEPIQLRMELDVRQPLRDVLLDVKIQSADGTVLGYATNTFDHGEPVALEPGVHEVKVSLENALHPGDYTLSIGLHRSTGHTVFAAEDLCPFTVDRVGARHVGGYPYPWVHGYMRIASRWEYSTTPLEPATAASQHGKDR